MDAVVNKAEVGVVRRGGWPWFAAVLAVLTLLFFRGHLLAEVRVEGLPLVVADPAQLDFGVRQGGEKFARTVPIRNTTDQPIRIDHFLTSCGCASIDPPAVNLPAHGQANFAATIEAKSAPGEVQVVRVTGHAKTGEILLIAYLTGRVQAVRQSNHRAAAFGR